MDRAALNAALARLYNQSPDLGGRRYLWVRDCILPNPESTLGRVGVANVGVGGSGLDQ